MALCGVAQICLCFCAPETSRLKRAISLSLVCQRALLHGEGQGSPQTFGKMLHNEEIWANVDLLENTSQAWRGWPGFCRQGAEVGEMPHGCRAASAVLRRPPSLPTACPASNCYSTYCLGYVQGLRSTLGMDSHTERRQKCNIL